MQKDSCVDEGPDCAMAAPGWRLDALRIGCASSTAQGPAQVLAQTRHELAQARELGMPEVCIRVLKCKVLKEEAEMKQAQPMGQRMDQARARFRRAVEAGEKAKEAMPKAQANFEQAQQKAVQAQLDLHKLMQEAPCQ